MYMRFSSLFLFAALVVLIPADADANERHFTYTYETSTLPAGQAEIEPWVTWRTGRDGYFRRFDHRIEFEVGMTDRLQTSLYINFHGTTFDDELLGRVSDMAYDGISGELKYRLMDPVADSVGLALYGELGLAGDETELEAKLLVDKRIGKMLYAANLVGELELEHEIEETEPEIVVEVDLAAGYFVTPRTVVGAELRNHTELPEGEFEHSSFFAGPVVAYSASAFWLAVTVQHQLFAIKSEEEPGNEGILEHAEHENINARIILGFHL